VKDEAVVKKWIDEQSWKTEFICLNVPEAQKLASREEVERHFREVHFANIIRPVESHRLLGTVAQQLPTPALRQLLRRAWDEQQRFPLKIVTTLSQQFASHGLQFFKVNKSITHVAVARPHYLDLEATPVSEGVKQIVDYINAHSGCTRRRLIEALAPSPPAVVARPTPGPTANPGAAEPGVEQVPAAPAPSSAAAPPPSGDLQEPTPEQTFVIADLHWLIHQGHVIEFANGRIETAKKPIPKPPRPEPKPAEAVASKPPAGDETTAGQETTANAEPIPAATTENASAEEQAALRANPIPDEPASSPAPVSNIEGAAVTSEPTSPSDLPTASERNA